MRGGSNSWRNHCRRCPHTSAENGSHSLAAQIRDNPLQQFTSSNHLCLSPLFGNVALVTCDHELRPRGFSALQKLVVIGISRGGNDSRRLPQQTQSSVRMS